MTGQSRGLESSARYLGLPSTKVRSTGLDVPVVPALDPNGLSRMTSEARFVEPKESPTCNLDASYALPCND